MSPTTAFRNTDPAAFYDCIAFNTEKRGVAVSDPVGGQLTFLATDGGHSRKPINPAGMPVPLANEYFFAASGTCLSAGVGRNLYLASGGAQRARVFTSRDGGAHWTVTDTPVTPSPSAGSSRWRSALQSRGASSAVTTPIPLPQ